MLTIDPDSRAAPYDQLRQQLTAAINDGELVAGAKLPTVRRLAADLGLAPNTVARTYLEMEREKLIETRGRRGSFVSDHDRPVPERSQAQHAANQYVDSVRRLRIDNATAIRLVQAALDEPTTNTP